MKLSTCLCFILSRSRYLVKYWQSIFPCRNLPILVATSVARVTRLNSCNLEEGHTFCLLQTYFNCFIYMWRIFQVAPLIKQHIVLNGSLMIGYQPLKHRDLPNFFRFVLTCHPQHSESDLDRVVTEIQTAGKYLQV